MTLRGLELEVLQWTKILLYVCKSLIWTTANWKLNYNIHKWNDHCQIFFHEQGFWSTYVLQLLFYVAFVVVWFIILYPVHILFCVPSSTCWQSYSWRRFVACLFIYLIYFTVLLLLLLLGSLYYFLFNNENSSKRKHSALCVSNKCTNWNRVCEWNRVPTISSPHSKFSVIRLPQFHSGFPIPCNTVKEAPSDTGARGKTDDLLSKKKKTIHTGPLFTPNSKETGK